jgi:hypothetical protein
MKNKKKKEFFPYEESFPEDELMRLTGKIIVTGGIGSIILILIVKLYKFLSK